MTELSFLFAQGLAIAALFLLRGGLEDSDLGIGLAVVGAPLIWQAAMLLPRLVGERGFQGVGRRQAVLAWVLAAVFAVLAWWATYQFAQKELFKAAWQLAATLGVLEALYGVYAVWFLQSRVAVNQREVSALLEGLAHQEYDVFLCHNSRDKAEVEEIAVQLMKHGLKPWLGVWALQPGLRWQPHVEALIRQVKSAAVFVGAEGLGPWQTQEMEAFLQMCVERNLPVIPVLLPNAPSKPQLPFFLSGRTCVDFRQREPDPLQQLMFGISGQRDFSAA